ncbi:VIT1/CCC1 transporter family protein [Nocardioides houyundeii]|uniref:VIT1/CCC1 transporter family protein n=1 Tax=Nocardioides houyundeii TaxID=2045452 RepID=UPI001F07302B|nr:VIT family protein [Nocardioides houyundeii]
MRTNPEGDAMGWHDHEPHDRGSAARLNWLRAGVLGANDGIVSTAGLVAGVAGATDDTSAIVVAGIAGVIAGALSMAAGEYVSVSTQRDSERSSLLREKQELIDDPVSELAELTGLLREKGISEPLARQVAEELTQHDALAAHADVELGLDPDALTNPWHAAWASMIAFVLGALLPLLVIAFSPTGTRVAITGLAVATALAVTGFISARLGGSPAGRAVLRTVTGGLLAMVVTHLVGNVVGPQV